MEFLSKSDIETKNKAKDLLKNLVENEGSQNAHVLALEGDLGSGKTTFTQGIAEALLITERVQSPTFVIEKIYKILNHPRWAHLVHIDAYRLDNESELTHLGWKEFVENTKNLIVIEWSERIKKVLPKKYIKIHIDHIGKNIRKIKIL